MRPDMTLSEDFNIPPGEIDVIATTGRGYAPGVRLPVAQSEIVSMPPTAGRIASSTSTSAGVQTNPSKSRAVSTTAQQVAEYFLLLVDQEAGDLMTNLRLQKLLYYAQAWHLAILGRPLFNDDFEAWVHGPVIPSLYSMYRIHGWSAIPAPDSTDFSPSEESRGVIKEVWGTYSQYSAKRLEEISHGEAPWQHAREGYGPADRCNVVICKEDIRQYYAARLSDE